MNHELLYKLIVPLKSQAYSMDSVGGHPTLFVKIQALIRHMATAY